MLLARPLSAIGGLLILVLLSRMLTSIEYGAYFSILAIMEILILSSNLGLVPAAYRYISASEWSDGSVCLEGPIRQLVFLRILSLLLFSIPLMALPAVAVWFLDASAIAPAMLPLVVLIVFTEGLARYIETLFESMQFQGRSQITLILRTLLRLAGLSILLINDLLSFHKFIYVELAATTSGMTIALFLLWSLNRQANKKFGKQTITTKTNIARMARFALPTYVAQVLGATSGPDALKLALGSVAGASAIAQFGFAYSIAAIVQRYMPVNILSGIFRPLFIAVSHQPDSDKALVELFNVSVKLNWIFVLTAYSFVYFGGDPLLALLSRGNYPDVGAVAACLLLSLIAAGLHLNLSLYCLAKENAWHPLIATTASMVGLPVGYILAAKFGALGIAVAFGITELIWSVVCLLALHASFPKSLQLDWTGFANILAIEVVALFFGTMLNTYLTDNWILSALLATSLFLSLILPSAAFSKKEKTWILSMIPFIRLKTH